MTTRRRRSPTRWPRPRVRHRRCRRCRRSRRGRTRPASWSGRGGAPVGRGKAAARRCSSLVDGAPQRRVGDPDSASPLGACPDTVSRVPPPAEHEESRVYPRRRRSRRATLGALSLAATLLAATAACTSGGSPSSDVTRSPSGSPDASASPSASASDAPVTLRLAVYGGPSELASYRRLARAYQRTDPQVTVEVETAADADTSWKRLDRQFGLDRAPDVFLADSNLVPRLVADDRVQPVDELLEDAGRAVRGQLRAARAGGLRGRLGPAVHAQRRLAVRRVLQPSAGRPDRLGARGGEGADAGGERLDVAAVRADRPGRLAAPGCRASTCPPS